MLDLFLLPQLSGMMPIYRYSPQKDGKPSTPKQVQEALTHLRDGPVGRTGRMTTEVQITKNRSHLLYLRKVISVISSEIGMTRKAIAQTHYAVARICSGSDGRLNIRLSASGICLVVEVSGAVLPEESRLKTRIGKLVDEVEFGEGTVRLTKSARRIEVKQPAYSPALGTTASQI